MRLILTADLHLDGIKFSWLLNEASTHDVILMAGDMLDIFPDAVFC